MTRKILNLPTQGDGMGIHSISSRKRTFTFRWLYIAGILLIALLLLWIWSLIREDMLSNGEKIKDLPITDQDGSLTTTDLDSSVIIRLSAFDVQHHLEADSGTVLLDVRSPEKYSEGHIPGAISMPLDSLDKRIDELNPESEIILVCGNGQLSLRAARILLDRGYNSVFTLDGGVEAWGNANLNLCTDC